MPKLFAEEGNDFFGGLEWTIVRAFAGSIEASVDNPPLSGRVLVIGGGKFRNDGYHSAGHLELHFLAVLQASTATHLIGNSERHLSLYRNSHVDFSVWAQVPSVKLVPFSQLKSNFKSAILNATMVCWKCSAATEVKPGERIGTRDECTRCGADLHSCRNCQFYDRSKSNQCSEPQAEWVRDKEAANYCDYFQPSSRAANRVAEPSSAQDAKKKFDSLFRS